MTDKPNRYERGGEHAASPRKDEDTGIRISGQEARQAEVVLQTSASKKIFLGTLVFIVIFPVLIVFLLGFF